MNIFWSCARYIDISLDRATWLEMIEALRARDHAVKLVTNYRHVKIHFVSGEKIAYPFTIKMKYINHAMYCLSLFCLLLHAVLKRRCQIVILGTYDFFVALPLNLLAKIGLIKTHFVLDIRSVPVLDSQGSFAGIHIQWHSGMQSIFSRG
jgi:hypothetical protein